MATFSGHIKLKWWWVWLSRLPCSSTVVGDDAHGLCTLHLHSGVLKRPCERQPIFDFRHHIRLDTASGGVEHPVLQAGSHRGFDHAARAAVGAVARRPHLSPRPLEPRTRVGRTAQHRTRARSRRTRVEQVRVPCSVVHVHVGQQCAVAAPELPGRTYRRPYLPVVDWHPLVRRIVPLLSERESVETWGGAGCGDEERGERRVNVHQRRRRNRVVQPHGSDVRVCHGGNARSALAERIVDLPHAHAALED